MAVTDVSIIHHVAIVFFVIWFLSFINRCHPVAYFASFVYLCLVHEGYITRLRRRLQFEERKQANQRRVLTDSETVRWLNQAVEKIWPICMEQIVSQKILLPIIPWFLEKYKPWTAKEAMVQHLYMGRNPPVFTDIRVMRNCTDDDHLVLELGMNFLTADDMSGLLAVKLRRRLGFGMSAKLHITGMHVEGKMTVKPISTHGVDVTELPGIAGWLDKLLSIAFEQTLVEPNMLVVDMEKFVSPQSEMESWFFVDEKEPIAHAKVEVIEASEMKPADLNGFSDPYVKGKLGSYRFRTKTQKKTLSPKWNEEFKIPICSWESPNTLAIEVRDKDYLVDDSLGDCTLNITEFRDGQRHDIWLPLQNIKMGRLHLAITVLEDIDKEGYPLDGETINKEDIQHSFASDSAHKSSFSSISSEKSQNMADSFEPINIEGQQQTGIWVHHPGSETAQSWEPRKGKDRRLDTKILMENPCEPHSNDSSSTASTDENVEGGKKKNIVQRGLKKMGSVFHRNPKKEDILGNLGEGISSPRPNLKAVSKTETSSPHLKVLSPEESLLEKSQDLPKRKFQGESGMARSTDRELLVRSNSSDSSPSVSTEFVKPTNNQKK